MSVARTRARIAKLRALAARPGTPAEGETARRLADELAATLPKAPGGFRLGGPPLGDLRWPPPTRRVAYGSRLIEIVVDELGRRVDAKPRKSWNP